MTRAAGARTPKSHREHCGDQRWGMADDYSASYSEDGFWDKLKRFAKTAGREVVERALWLWYALQKPETPAWA